MLFVSVVKHLYIIIKRVFFMDEKILTVKERAYILDKIGGTDFYVEEFGRIDEEEEKVLVVSVFRKLELTYRFPTSSKYFSLKHLNFTEEQAKEALEDLEEFRKMFEEALSD